MWEYIIPLISAGVNYASADSASDAVSDSAANATALQKYIFDTTNGQQAPFREGGTEAVNELRRLLGLGGDANSAGYGSMNRDFSMADFQADPGYGFRVSEGLKALQNSAAAKGGLLSGNFLRGATEYGQNMGSQEYGNAFNRFQTNRTNRLNPLLAMADKGQLANQQSAQAGQNYANQAGDIMTGAGSARAGAYLNQGRTVSNALNQMGSIYNRNNTGGNWQANTNWANDPAWDYFGQ